MEMNPKLVKGLSGAEFHVSAIYPKYFYFQIVWDTLMIS
jgi:hypothetical protein